MKLPPAFIAAVLAAYADGSLNERTCEVLGNPANCQPAEVTRQIADFLCANDVGKFAATGKPPGMIFNLPGGS